jgi:hypothetical protein
MHPGSGMRRGDATRRIYSPGPERSCMRGARRESIGAPIEPGPRGGGCQSPAWKRVRKVKSEVNYRPARRNYRRSLRLSRKNRRPILCQRYPRLFSASNPTGKWDWCLFASHGSPRGFQGPFLLRLLLIRASGLLLDH